MKSQKTPASVAEAQRALRDRADEMRSIARKMALLEADATRAAEAIQQTEGADAELAAARAERDAELGQAFIDRREPNTTALDRQIAMAEKTVATLRAAAHAAKAAMPILSMQIAAGRAELSEAEERVNRARVAECNARHAAAAADFATQADRLRYPFAEMLAAEHARVQFGGKGYEVGRALLSKLERDGLYVFGPDGFERPAWVWNDFPERAKAADRLLAALTQAAEGTEEESL
jgi:hypothetical protein